MRHRGVSGDGTVDASREGGGGPLRPDSGWSVGEAADGPEVEDEEGAGYVFEAKRDDRADLWAVEAGVRVAAVFDARSGFDAWRVATDGDGAQFVEALAK